MITVHVAYKTYGLSGYLDVLLKLGQFGVQLFFVVSAFTLCMSVEGRRDPDTRTRWCHFAIRRFFRIAPLYYVGILVYFLLRCQTETDVCEKYSTSTVLMNLTFTHGLSEKAMNFVVPGGWSIANEAMFYMMFPFLVRIGNSVRRMILMLTSSCLVLIALNLGVTGTLHPENHSYHYFWIFTQLPVFCLGMLAFRVWKKGVILTTVPVQTTLWLIVSLSLGSGVYAFDRYLGLAPLLFGAGFAAFLLLAVNAARPLGLLFNPWTAGIGKISYSVYIVHFIFAWWLVPEIAEAADLVVRPRVNFAISWSLVLIFSTLVAMVTWKYIEKPFIQIGRSLIRTLSAACKEASPQPPAS